MSGQRGRMPMSITRSRVSPSQSGLGESRAQAAAIGAGAEQHHERADEHADDPRGEEAAEEEDGERAPADPERVEVEGPPGEPGQEGEDHEPARDADEPGTERQVPHGDRREELVLHRLAPDVVEHRIGDVELADLDRREGHGADQDEGGVRRRESEEPSHEPDREHAHRRPEGQLEDEEDVARRHQQVAQRERPDPDQLMAHHFASSMNTSSSWGSRTSRSRTTAPDSWSRCSTSPSRFCAESTVSSTRPSSAVVRRMPGRPASAAAPPASTRSAITSPSLIARFNSSELPRASRRPFLTNAISSHSSSASRM